MTPKTMAHQKDGQRVPLGELPNPANIVSVADKKHQIKHFMTPQTVLRKASATKAHPIQSIDNKENEPVLADQRRAPLVSEKLEGNEKRESGISVASTNDSSRKRKTYIGHWQLGRTIGKGGCSRVRVVRHRHSGHYGAVKIITRSTAEHTRAQSLANLGENVGHQTDNANGYKPIPFGLEREIAIMKLLEHKNIVRLYDVWENSNELYLIMEYVDGGELFHYVDQRKGLSEYEAVHIFRQIVSALRYCHRLRICHRDLKPENILLDQSSLTVKLIDFGMAALQPEGRLLSTPCGSPHYAAPEVVSGRPYDGTLADVWSCGVILYVMLTGTAPFNFASDGDIRGLFRDIAQARYYMPPELSLEAKDLLQHIFIPDPTKRFDVSETWNHALLHKYEAQGELGDEVNLIEASPEFSPTNKDWKVQRARDIDREVLRNMRTLWHSETEQGLVRKLLNKECNQEKLFYAALIKHRDEHLAKYEAGNDCLEIGHSASDYHHNQAPLPSRSSDLNVTPHSQSQYSIMNDEHLRQSHVSMASAASFGTYDPYRASPISLTKGQPGHAKVVIHPGLSFRHTTTSRGSHTLRHPNALRIEVFKQGKMRTSVRSASEVSTSINSRASLNRSPASKRSLSSTTWASSPPVIAVMRPSELHKRGVSFSHLRRSSTISALAKELHDIVQDSAAPSVLTDMQEVTDSATFQMCDTPSPSPPESGMELLRSRKDKHILGRISQSHLLRVDVTKQNMRREIRKHSAELEKVCEDAFFKGPLASTNGSRGLETARLSTPDTFPSSVFGLATEERPDKAQTHASSGDGRVDDTPKTYLLRTLEETRDKLAAYASGDEDSLAKFDEVMKVLENFAQTPIPKPLFATRNFSAPEAKMFDARVQLPIISEENDVRQVQETDATSKEKRSMTSPLPEYEKTSSQTIRVVPVSPLRSTSAQSSALGEHYESLATSHDLLLSCQDDASRMTNLIRPPADEKSTEEDVVSGAQKDVQKAKTRWFKLARKTNRPPHASNASPLPVNEPIGPFSDQQLHKPKLKPNSSGAAKGSLRKKKSITDWLSWKHHDMPTLATHLSSESDRSPHPEPSTDRYNIAAASSEQRLDEPPLSTSSPVTHIGEKVTDETRGRSWFARFFKIKPLVKVLCFTIPRNRVRQELVILLREWQRHGVREIQYCRDTNSISADVDRNNALNIRPVSFRIELFVVLEHGRKVGMSIARIAQVRGAASGFRKVVEVLHGVMRDRGWLVEDEEKWRALSDIVLG